MNSYTVKLFLVDLIILDMESDQMCILEFNLF